MIKRFDRLDVATSDLADAAANYERNFGFTVRRTPGADDATVVIGDAEIRLRRGAAVASVIAETGEGLAAIWLEADDVDQIATALRNAKLEFAPVRIEDGRRILAVDPKSANMVALYIFDRRA